MKRPSTYRAENAVTLEQIVLAFQQATEAQRRAAYLKLTTTGEDRAEEAPLDEMEIVTRPQLARLMKCSKANIDYHRRLGRLTPVYVPGSSRLRGFTARSVRDLLKGNFAKEVL